MPGVQFQVDASWYTLNPPLVIAGSSASISQAFAPGKGYGWMIGLWQAKNTRLKVTIPKAATATMAEVGLPDLPALAQEIPAVTGLCECWDGTIAACSEGSRFSNGLLGAWYQSNEFYVRAGAFNACPLER